MQSSWHTGVYGEWPKALGSVCAWVGSHAPLMTGPVAGGTEDWEPGPPSLHWGPPSLQQPVLIRLTREPPGPCDGGRPVPAVDAQPVCPLPLGG